MTCEISKVKLMSYSSDGYQNYSFPKESLSFNVYINKNNLPKDLEDFLNTSYTNLISDNYDQFEIFNKPIELTDEEDEEKATIKKMIKQEGFLKEKIDKEVVLSNENVFEANYVFRISL